MKFVKLALEFYRGNNLQFYKFYNFNFVENSENLELVLEPETWNLITVWATV